MNDEILKIRGCIAAANDIAEKSVKTNDKFDKQSIDKLIDKIDDLKAKLQKKLSEQPVSSK